MIGRPPIPLGLLVGLGILAVAATAGGVYIEDDPHASDPDRRTETRLPATPHVPELAAYLAEIDAGEPLIYRDLAVCPVMRQGGSGPGGRWLTMDAAIQGGDLVVAEVPGGGSVPTLLMHNRSRDAHVLILAGEVVSGGKQTRTVRQDTILAPGQKVTANVFCVEAHRWKGGDGFKAGGVVVPQSIQKELRKGADQGRVWSEVARNNAALGTENRTGSLETGLKAPKVRADLEAVRKTIVPEMPKGCVGFVFVDRRHGHAVGAELFGRADLAAALLPKLLDAYAVDLVLQRDAKADRRGTDDREAARAMLGLMRRTGSHRAETPGSGAGIQMRSSGLVGDGLGLGADLVHFGCQVEQRIVPAAQPTRDAPAQQSSRIIR